MCENLPEAGSPRRYPLDIKRPPAAAGEGARNSSQDWYYATRGLSFGPVTKDELAALARAGFFVKGDCVYADYVGGWVRADSVPGLFDDVGRSETPAGSPSREGIYVPPLAFPPGAAAPMIYAGLWTRAATAVMDWGAVMLPIMVLTAITAKSPAGPSAIIFPKLDLPLIRHVPIPVLPIVLGWFYFAWFESSAWCATPAKRAAGLMVTDLFGKRISFVRATRRYLASWYGLLLGMCAVSVLDAATDSSFAPFLVLGALSADFLICFVTPRRQALHDLAAGTVVIEGRA